MQRRNLLLAAGAAALSGWTTGCAPGDTYGRITGHTTGHATRRSTGLRTINVAVDNHPSMSPFYLALERGYFREAGIDARPLMAGGSAQAVSLLVVGRLDAALAPVGPALFNVALHGSNVRAVLGREKVTGGCGATGALYARRSSFPAGTGDIQQWTGKKICSGKGAGTPEFCLDTILSRAGLNSGQTEHKRMTDIASYAALVSGAIDGILHGSNARLEFGSNPEIVREDAGRRLLDGMQVSHIIFGPSLLEQETSVGGRFLASFLRGVKAFESGGTPRFLDDFVASTSGRQSLIGQCRNYNTSGGSIDRASIAAVQQWAVRKGYAPSGGAVDSFIDERFLDWARKEGDAA